MDLSLVFCSLLLSVAFLLVVSFLAKSLPFFYHVDLLSEARGRKVGKAAEIIIFAVDCKFVATFLTQSENLSCSLSCFAKYVACLIAPTLLA